MRQDAAPTLRKCRVHFGRSAAQADYFEIDKGRFITALFCFLIIPV